jgi:hypothetical protein
MKTVIGLFPTRTEAVGAVERLVAAGLSADAISVAFPSEDSTEPTVRVVTDEAAALGALSGAAAGTLVGLLVAGSSLVIPGIGTFIVAGPVASAMAGAGLGAGAGGLVGALAASPGAKVIDALEALVDASDGPVVLTARVIDDRADEVEDLLELEGARRTERL